MSDLRDFLEGVVYHTGDRRRYTQQSPVMPDVWISYGMDPGEQLELLLVPDWHYTPAALAAALKERLDLNGDRNKRLAKFRHSRKKSSSPRSPTTKIRSWPLYGSTSSSGGFCR